MERPTKQRLPDTPTPSVSAEVTPHESPDLQPTCDFEPDVEAIRMVAVLDQYLDDLKAGRAISHAELIAANPDLAQQLEACLAGIDFLGPSAIAVDPPKQLGDFLIEREVGRGGMGTVFQATQISLGRQVALKVLRFGSASNANAIDRFRRESETVASLHHTNIVPIYSVGSEHGVNYYAMQFIQGQSLDLVLKAAESPFDSNQVVQWGLQAAEALAYAHQRGVIHRDVKPSNLILDDDEGRIWLTDFGLAKQLDDVTLSMTGALLGTPRYMSPEQADATRRKVDHRTDLYSLGATLYELLSGQPVFHADTPHEVLHKILSDDPERLRKHQPAVPRDLETIVMKCLSKDPAERYSTANELVQDLRAFLDNRPIREAIESFGPRGQIGQTTKTQRCTHIGYHRGDDGRCRNKLYQLVRLHTIPNRPSQLANRHAALDRRAVG